MHMSAQQQVDCATACVNGCVLGDACPNREFAAEASQFIEKTSLDDMLAMAQEAVRKKQIECTSQPTEWVIPDEI